MPKLDLGKVKGSTWYQGNGITGNSTTPTVFPDSGVTLALEDDLYLNLYDSDRGKIYSCTLKGDASTAEWVYVGSILGPMPEVVDGLTSSSVTKALSANMGRYLNNLITDVGLYPNIVTPTSGQRAYTASMVIEDKTTEFTITDLEGNIGTYSYTEAGGSTATVNITIGTSIGLPETGADIKAIESSEAVILRYTLYGSHGEKIYEETPSLWKHITDDEQNIIPGINITDGLESLKTGSISKLIDNIRTTLYPITHAKAVWFSKENNKTIFDKLLYMNNNEAPTEVSPSENDYSVGDHLIYNDIRYIVTSAITEGDALNVGVNIEEKTSDKEFSSIKNNIASINNSISSMSEDITQLQQEITSLSHVGMIIHSTTLNTEAKVKAVYGGNTWIRHSGYFLRGANAGVIANSALKTGGSDDAVVVAHTHTVSASGGDHTHSVSTSGGSHTHTVTVTGGNHAHSYTAPSTYQENWDNEAKSPQNQPAGTPATTGYSGDLSLSGTTAASGSLSMSGSTSDSGSLSVSGTAASSGVSGVNQNLPSYKSVYIWERTA